MSVRHFAVKVYFKKCLRKNIQIFCGVFSLSYCILFKFFIIISFSSISYFSFKYSELSHLLGLSAHCGDCARYMTEIENTKKKIKLLSELKGKESNSLE